MRIQKCLAGLVSCMVAVSAVGAASAAGSQASVMTQQKVVAGYRLMLEIGPAQNMDGMSNTGGDTPIGGKSATCRLPGKAATSGMSMHATMCNRHISLHVFNAKTNKVVIRAHVAITMREMKKHMTIAVPIMMMMGSGHVHDFQYGNNVTAGPGAYSVAVTVNGLHAAFAATLK
jgi:invasion protein IalB